MTCGHQPIIEELREAVAVAEARAAAAEAKVAELLALVEELRARLDKNSSNSSKPPSSDMPGTQKAPKKQPSGRKPGGQPGHHGHHRAPVGDPDKINDVFPDACGHCGGELVPDDEVVGDEPVRHQVIEIPRPRPIVEEQRLHRCRCRTCGRKTRARLPKGVPTGG